MTQHGPVPFTQAEEDARDAFEAVKNAKKPMEDWKEVMLASDSDMPRYLEDLITDNSSLTIHEKMKTHYDEKVALRATKPK
jgi:hypothetical protein